MSRKRKKKPLPPRHKRMKRPARLQAARAWLAKYPGKSVVTGYKKHFAVDALCALAELQMLGVKLDPEYAQRVRSAEESRIEARRRERERRKAAAVKLFEIGKLSSGAAARLAGVPRAFFLARLVDYGVDTFRLTEEDLHEETRLS